MTDSMDPLYDRTRERLGASDTMLIRSRRRLVSAAKRFAETGHAPATVDRPELYRSRVGSTLLPKDADWLEATRELRAAFPDHSDLDWAITGGCMQRRATRGRGEFRLGADDGLTLIRATQMMARGRKPRGSELAHSIP